MDGARAAASGVRSSREGGEGLVSSHRRQGNRTWRHTRCSSSLICAVPAVPSVPRGRGRRGKKKKYKYSGRAVTTSTSRRLHERGTRPRARLRHNDLSSPDRPHHRVVSAQSQSQSLRQCATRRSPRTCNLSNPRWKRQEPDDRVHSPSLLQASGFRCLRAVGPLSVETICKGGYGIFRATHARQTVDTT